MASVSAALRAMSCMLASNSSTRTAAAQACDFVSVSGPSSLNRSERKGRDARLRDDIPPVATAKLLLAMDRYASCRKVVCFFPPSGSRAWRCPPCGKRDYRRPAQRVGDRVKTLLRSRRVNSLKAVIASIKAIFSIVHSHITERCAGTAVSNLPVAVPTGPHSDGARPSRQMSRLCFEGRLAV